MDRGVYYWRYEGEKTVKIGRFKGNPLSVIKGYAHRASPKAIEVLAIEFAPDGLSQKLERSRHLLFVDLYINGEHFNQDERLLKHCEKLRSGGAILRLEPQRFPAIVITDRQKEVLKFISSFLEQYGHSPSFKEIGKALGVSSPATVYKHVNALQEKGVIRHEYNEGRSIEIPNVYAVK